MNVLIIGGSGFIGLNLYNHLKNINDINVKGTYSSNKFKNFIKYNLGDPLPKAIIDFEPEVIINTSWYGIPNFGFENSYNNLQKNLNFLKKIKEIKSLKKLILLGSCWELLDKDKITNDIQYFLWAKNSINTIYSQFCLSKKIYFNWVRIFYVYVIYQRKKSLIQVLFKSAKNKKKFVVNNPNDKQDFIYIKDVVEILKELVYSKNSFDINLGSGYLTKVSDIKNIIYGFYDKKIKKVNLNQKENLSIKNDISFLKKNFPWFPRYDIKIGLEDLKNK